MRVCSVQAMGLYNCFLSLVPTTLTCLGFCGPRLFTINNFRLPKEWLRSKRHISACIV